MGLKSIVFLGPSMRISEARQILENAEFRPPVSQGDVYRATLQQVDTIGIIDGYFDGVPSVWHKEILSAIDRGISVYGAASMGALRAAELEAFGMIGVGTVFEWYRDGLLEDDDEVAVLHGPQEWGYLAVTEPMVNIRATLEEAMLQNVISRVDGNILLGMAKSLNFRDRTYQNAVRGAMGAISPGSITRFTDWLSENKINKKRDDAILMLRAIKHRQQVGSCTSTKHFYFERTVHWEELRRDASEFPFVDSPDAAVLSKLTSDEELWRQVSAIAVAIYLSTDKAQQMAVAVAEAERQRWAHTFCRERSLTTVEDVDTWLANNNCSMETLRSILDSMAFLEWVKRNNSSDILARSLDVLRYSGDYERLLGDR